VVPFKDLKLARPKCAGCGASGGPLAHPVQMPCDLNTREMDGGDGFGACDVRVWSSRPLARSRTVTNQKVQ
jgi:hypothetical protein